MPRNQPPDQRLERIVRLVADAVQAPCAALSLVSAQGTWFKARVGLRLPDTERVHAFCAHVVRTGEVLAIADARRDRRFAKSDLVVGEPHVRGYLGVPLVGPCGRLVGALAALDPATRAWACEDVARLIDAAALAAEALFGPADIGVGAVLDGVLTVDAAGTIGQLNARAEAMFGAAADEMNGMPILRLFAASGLRSALEETIGGGAALTDLAILDRRIEARAVRADGREFPAEVVFSPVDVGGLERFAVVVRDVSARKASEAELAGQRARLEEQARLLDHVPAAIMAVDYVSGRITYWNRGAEAVYGWRADEVVGRDKQALLRTIMVEDRRAVYAELEAAGAWHGQVIEHHRDGHVMAVDTRWELRRDEAGAPMSVVKINTEATERLRTEGELVRARDLAQQANRAKSAFLANMSHELRTPLNAILGYSELVREELADAGHDAFVPDLRRIEEAGRHLLRLIDVVLDISKIDAGTMTIEPGDVNLPELVEQVASQLRPELDRRGNAFVLAIQPGLPALWSDAGKLRQILFNLVANANKFTERGRVVVEAGLEQTAAGPAVRVAIADTGVGMAPEVVDRLFADFVQADDTTTRRYGGTGLGLAISRRLCEMLGGTIEATSQRGVGSVFTVRIPWREPAPSPAPSPLTFRGTSP